MYSAWVKPSTSAPGSFEAFRYTGESCTAWEFFSNEEDAIEWAYAWATDVVVGYPSERPKVWEGDYS